MINRSIIRPFFLLLLIVGLLLPAFAFAQTVAATEAPFTVHKTDYFLTKILAGFLGNVVDPTATGAATVISSTGNLGEIFRTFNLGVAFFGTLMVTFISVVGVLQSGNDGEFLGKRWSSMWVPVRFAAGSALMLPLTSSGYSLVQAMVLWIVLQGVSFTDTLWDTVVTTIAGRTTAQVWGTIDGADLAKKVAESEVCVAAVSQIAASSPTTWTGELPALHPSSDTTTSKTNSRVSTTKYVVNWGKSQLKVFGYDIMGTNEGDVRMCGQMSLSVSKDEDDIYRDARQIIGEQHNASLSNMASAIRPAAIAYVQAFSSNDPSVLASAISNLRSVISTAGTNYRVEVATIADGAIKAARSAATVKNLPTTDEDMKKYGFVTAGMYYIDMTRLHGAVREAVTAAPSYLGPSTTSLSGQSANFEQVMSKFRALASVAAAANVEDTKVGSANVNAPVVLYSGDGSEDLPDGKSFFSGWTTRLSGALIRAMFGVGGSNTGTSGGVGQISQWAESSVNNNTSSVMELKNKGDNILDMTGAVLASFVAVNGANEAGYAITISSFVPASSLAAGIPGFLKGAIAASMPIIMAIAFALVSFGLTLSIYVPMLPYMLWMGGVTGYLILIAEALVASSLWAVMLMHPSGEGFTSQHADRGVMLLLGLFTRPALMLMGMVTGMFMLEPLVMMINDTFYYTMMSVQGQTTSLLFSLIGFCSIYCALIITAANKCFAMIHLMPDKVLRWIGGGGEQLGETDVERSASQNLVAVGGGFSSAANAGKREKERAQIEKKSEGAGKDGNESGDGGRAQGSKKT